MENSFLPKTVLDEMEKRGAELKGFGSVTLKITYHDFQARYTIGSEKSIIPGKATSGSAVEP